MISFISNLFFFKTRIKISLFTESSPSPQEASETTKRPFYEPRIPSTNTGILSSKSDLPNPSSYLSINLLDEFEQGNLCYTLLLLRKTKYFFRILKQKI